ncbi:hypothetical protein SBRCBS47491_008643 [Sporothrix bragantina]|uniref:AA1-like domain-containing protein n=1 Tax=Sporothrix bragantina TaxID=671064 RepID=A0ABP0CN42_9PEZI
MLSHYVALGLAFVAGAGPAVVSAAPHHLVYLAKPADDAYEWTVTNWAAQYSEDNALCSYSFNISGPYSGGQMPIPAFVAWCAGTGVGAPYALCHITDLRNTTKRRQVAAKLLPPATTATEVEASLAVSYRYDDLNTADSWWNYTSYATQPYSNTVAGGGQASLNGTSNDNATTTFTMTPSEAFGVA